MVAVGRLHTVAAFLSALEAYLIHEPSHAIASVAFPLFAQFHDHARTAIGLPAGLVNVLNVFSQGFVFSRTRSGSAATFLPAIIAAG